MNKGESRIEQPCVFNANITFSTFCRKSYCMTVAKSPISIYQNSNLPARLGGIKAKEILSRLRDEEVVFTFLRFVSFSFVWLILEAKLVNYETSPFTEHYILESPEVS